MEPINIEDAWLKQSGFDIVKVGVFDTGVNWRHEDFGDGTWLGSKIAGGWDYRASGNGISPKDQTNPDPLGHGTAVAGIIGALRNNGKGIAGIAGGDVDSTGNKGVQLYSFGHHVYTGALVEAVIEGVLSSPNTGTGYGINILNCSFGIPFENKELRNVYVHEAIVSASSGNDWNGGTYYPASFEDKWVLKVGANDSTGTRAALSNFDNSFDFIAPGMRDIFASLEKDDNTGYSYQDDGTSYAAPHVTGVAALMYSQHHPLRDTLYPNVLSPEDADEILKRTATPVENDIVFSPSIGSLQVPNQYAGYGRINAGEAINSVSLPYRVRHIVHEVNTVTATLFATDQVMSYPDGYPYIDFATPQTSGWTADTVDIYKLTVNINHQSYSPSYTQLPYIPPTESFVDGWIRNSVCEIYGLTNTIYNVQWAGATLENIDINGATITGYLYKAKVYDDSSDFVTDSWYPASLGSTVKLGYTIYTIDDNPYVGIDEEELHLKVNLFPNPAKNELNFSFDANNDVQLEVYDISGRKINSYNFIKKGTEIHSESIDISTYNNGIYLCRFIIDGKQITRKFIKQ
ncbi:MAG: S8/S53 family peptidase [Brumimicrobium sp.]